MILGVFTEGAIPWPRVSFVACTEIQRGPPGKERRAVGAFTFPWASVQKPIRLIQDNSDAVARPDRFRRSPPKCYAGTFPELDSMCCDPDAHYRGFGFPDLETPFPRVDLASPHREMPFPHLDFAFPDLETPFPRVDLAFPHREMPFPRVRPNPALGAVTERAIPRPGSRFTEGWTPVKDRSVPFRFSSTGWER